MKPSFSAKSLTRAAIFGALTLISSLIRIPVGPVPVTMQTLVVNCSAVFLTPYEAVLAMCVHLILRMLFAGGPAIISMPSFGFVLGFILASFIGSLIFHRSSIRSFPLRLFLSLFAAAAIPYALGLPYMAYILNFVQGLSMGVAEILQKGLFIFIPGDLIKLFLSYVISRKYALEELREHGKTKEVRRVR